jgi:O-antigen/teichoic acid export membrane protein
LKLSAWAKHFLVYGLGVILMNLPQVLLIPIYTHRVPPSVYGVLELLNRSQEILLLIFSFGLRSALLTFFQMAGDEPDRQKGVYSTALQFLSTFGIVAILLMILGSRLWSQLLFGNTGYAAAVVLILLATYFEMVFQMAVLYLQSNLKSVLYVSVFSTRAVLAIVLNIILVFWWRWGLMGILWATLLHTAIYAVAILAYMFRRTGFTFDRKMLGEMLRFGFPVMIGAFAGFMLNSGDRYFLNIYTPRAEIGLYGLGYKIGTLSMLLVLMPFGKIWSVTMVDISKKPDGPHQLGKIATYLLCACTFSTLALSLLGPYLIRFFSERSYWEAYRVIPIVGAAYIFYSWSTIMDASFYVTKRTVYKVYSISLAGVIVTLLYWLLIPRYGMMGAAWATLGGYFAFAILTLIYAQRIYFIHYEFGRIALLFGIGTLFYKVGALVPITPGISGLVLRAAIALGFPVALWLGGFLDVTERRALVDSWYSLQSRYLSKAVARTADSQGA